MPKVLLFSGGIDSYVAYKWYESKWEQVLPLYVDLWGIYWLREWEYVKQLLPQTKRVECFIPQKEDENAFIPARNLLLATIALQFWDEIIMWWLKDDNCEDKNEAIFKEFSDILTRISRKEVKVISPFWKMTKDEVVKWYLEQWYSVDELKKTVSCYNWEHYCWKCPSCFRKWVVFNNNGIKLDFYNEELINSYKKRMESWKYDKHRAEITLKVINNYFNSK